MKRFKPVIFLLALMASLCPVKIDAATLSIGKVSIDDIGMSRRLLRMNDNGLIVDQSGLCLEVSVNINASGIMGKRVICEVVPLSSDGRTWVDAKGEVAAIEGVTVPTNSYSGKVVLPMPYSWIVNEDSQKSKTVCMMVTVACMEEDGLVESKDITIQESDINIDKKQIGNKLMSDMLGGGSGGGGLMEGLIGGLFDTSDAESTEPCPACDGTCVCVYCDGDGFFDPKSCRKCANDPGICRRCKGEGTVTVKYDIY